MTELRLVDLDEVTLAQLRDFLRLSGAPVVEGWMFARRWCLHIGCDVCADAGPAAACWGADECHGFANGCGCVSCAVKQIRVAGEAERPEAAA